MQDLSEFAEEITRIAAKRMQDIADTPVAIMSAEFGEKRGRENAIMVVRLPNDDETLIHTNSQTLVHMLQAVAKAKAFPVTAVFVKIGREWLPSKPANKKA